MMEQAQPIDLEAIQNEAKEKGRELLDQAVTFAREQPHLAVAAALGIGWILGNGLSPRIVTAGAKLGMRALFGGALAGSGLLGVLGGEDGGFGGFAGKPSVQQEERDERRGAAGRQRRQKSES